jgi:hypothetical protein
MGTIMTKVMIMNSFFFLSIVCVCLFLFLSSFRLGVKPQMADGTMLSGAG